MSADSRDKAHCHDDEVEHIPWVFKIVPGSNAPGQDHSIQKMQEIIVLPVCIRVSLNTDDHGRLNDHSRDEIPEVGIFGENTQWFGYIHHSGG